MDAREYLARKGLDGSRDEKRPNTLEEKAWERARESGVQQPRAGTPHDWEEWERHHQTLAEEAGTIEQKFNRDLYRSSVATREPARQPHAAVQEYVPPTARTSAHDGEVESPGPRAGLKEAWQATPSLRFAYGVLAVLFPPAAVGLAGGGTKRTVISLLLTLLGWLPGCLYVWWWLRRQMN